VAEEAVKGTGVERRTTRTLRTSNHHQPTLVVYLDAIPLGAKVASVMTMELRGWGIS